MTQERESWLAATMVALADTGGAGFNEAAYATSFAFRLAELLSPAEVGVFLAVGIGHPVVTTGSSERAAGLALLEAQGAAGPSGDCCDTGRAAGNQSIAAAVPRWPEFAAAAIAVGLKTVSSLPMRHLDETVGAVTALSTGGRPLTAAKIDLAALLTEAAAISILQRRALQRSIQTSVQLQQALDSRVVIEQAKGAVAAWLETTPGDAFELLRGYSRRNSRRLAEVAADVIRGAIPAYDLTVTGKPATAP